MTIDHNTTIYIVFKPTRYDETITDLIHKCGIQNWPTQNDQARIAYVVTDEATAQKKAVELLTKALRQVATQLPGLKEHIATLNELIDGDTEDGLGATLLPVREFLESLA